MGLMTTEKRSLDCGWLSNFVHGDAYMPIMMNLMGVIEV